MKEIVIDKSNYNQEVLQSDRLVLIDFWAPWCGPCKMLSPVISSIAQEHDEIKVCKVNVDEQPEIARAFQVSSIPLLVVIQDKKIIHMSVGYKPKEEILAMIQK